MIVPLLLFSLGNKFPSILNAGYQTESDECKCYGTENLRIYHRYVVCDSGVIDFLCSFCSNTAFCCCLCKFSELGYCRELRAYDSFCITPWPDLDK